MERHIQRRKHIVYVKDLPQNSSKLISYPGVQPTPNSLPFHAMLSAI